MQTIAWFVDLHRKDQLDVNPPYQRMSIWNQKYRDFFIDTILNGYPFPPFFFTERSMRMAIPRTTWSMGSSA